MEFELDKDILLYTKYRYIKNIDVNVELDETSNAIEIINKNHPFISYIRGFIHNNIKINILHGWYHINSKTVNFYINDNPSIYGDIIDLAWQKYWNNDSYNYNVSIYANFCGDLYKSNEYDIDYKKSYSKILKNLMEDFINVSI